MPPAAAVVAGAVLAGVGSFAAGATIFGLSAGLTAVIIGATNLVLGLGASFLAEKPSVDLPNLSSFTARAQNRTQTLRQPITPRRLVYGEARVAGPMIFAESTGNNRFLHLVVALGQGPFEAIDEVWLNADPIFSDDLDSDGLVTAGKYKNKVRIKKYLGEADQVADPDLVDEVASWTAAHRLRGMAYIYLRLEFDRDLFPTSIPNPSAWVKGRKVADVRQGGSPVVWTPNAVLCTRDYMLDQTLGLGAGPDEFDDDQAAAGANVCDEFVTVLDADFTASAVSEADDAIDLDLPRLSLQTGDVVQVSSTDALPAGLQAGINYFAIPVRRRQTDHKDPRIRLAASYADALTGTAVDLTDAGSGTLTVTKKGEPRYALSGVVETDRPPSSIIEEMLTAMGARAVYGSGQWRVLPAAWALPSLSLDENDLRGPIEVQTKITGRDRFNAVKGIFVSPERDGQPDDYPPAVNALYQAADGGRRKFRELSLPFTTRANQAQRLAKIALERHRQEISVTARWSLRCLQVQAGDRVELTNQTYGWDRKVFEVEAWALIFEESDSDAPALLVEMGLRETAAGIFEFDSGLEETRVDLAPDTNLPNPFDVAQPTGIGVFTQITLTAAGDIVRNILVTWMLADDFYVVNGGHYQLRFKKSSATFWQQSWTIDGADNSAQTPPVNLDESYDLEIRSVNHLGITSPYARVFGYVVGSSGAGVTSKVDEGLVSESVTNFVDEGLVSQAVTVTNDEGAIGS
ncbi:phage tail protein [Pelagibius sp.]|uniref:phage tail protein n=1 Tax=Pelagibius sp. TaxID=1931238 RepID=UPI00262A9E84|nr:phage tail protein [Pelagibius sp.]